jgi:hypothetical protein
MLRPSVLSALGVELQFWFLGNESAQYELRMDKEHPDIDKLRSS